MSHSRVELMLARGREMPRTASWLTPGERAQLSGLRLPRARRDYRLGRWTAKHAVSRYLGAAGGLAATEIRRAEDGAPEAWRNGSPAACSLSLSHRGGAALCAVGPAGLGLGCDLEWVEPRSRGFVTDFLAPHEARRVLALPEPARSRLANLLWSAKESAVKALRIGLDVDTRDVPVEVREPLEPGGFGSLQVHVPGLARALRGWWCAADDWIATLAATAPTRSPVCLTWASQPAGTS